MIGLVLFFRKLGVTLDIRTIPVLRPKRTSTSSTPMMGSIHKIKAEISAPTTREVTIITLLLV
jgi:hypothetical protein